MTDIDNNPFNGLSRAPSNAELWANWRTALSYAPYLLALLWVEHRLLGEMWAGALLRHALPIFVALAMITWRTRIVAALLTVLIALCAGVRAFWAALQAPRL